MSYSEQKLTIKSWAEGDRPREKLLEQGRASLSNAELLAILIGSGSRNESAVDLCKRILASAENNLNALGKLSVPDLLQFKGIGEAKAISIVAALELGRRRKSEEVKHKKKIQSSKDAFEWFYEKMNDLPNEEFWALLLNRSNQVIKRIVVSKGGVSGTVVDTRLLFKPAVESLASGIIVGHNHPSGNQKPSNADIQITKKIKEGAAVLDMNVLDHIIVCGETYYSFADEGIL